MPRIDKGYIHTIIVREGKVLMEITGKPGTATDGFKFTSIFDPTAAKEIAVLLLRGSVVAELTQKTIR